MPGERGQWSVFPNAVQELVLEAAFCPRERFDAPWARLVEALGDVEPGFGTRTLLPLLEPRLAGMERRGLVATCRADYRRNWLNNQRLIALAVARLEGLHAAGIPTVVLKGTALIARYYRDPGLRHMSDLDVLVPEERFHEAAKLLEAMGYRPLEHPPELFDLRFGHAIAYRDRSGHDVDLHGHVLTVSCERGADAAFWEAAEPLDLAAGNSRTATSALCPTDQLLHTLVHGMTWESPPAVRWVADALIVLERSAVDWRRLAALSRARGVALAVAAALGYLRERFDVEVPEGCLNDLRAAEDDPATRRLLGFLTGSMRGHPLRAFRHHRHMVERAVAAEPEVGSARMLYRFVLHWCRTDRPGGVPPAILAKALRGAGHRLRPAASDG